MRSSASGTILLTEMEEEQTPSNETIEELRLFPLGVGLFPGMTMPLRIFEERYKLMIGECLDSDEPFGVLLIREGREVGGFAKPYSVGTTARITRVERLEDGRMNLDTMGERRFRMVDTVHEMPYLKGRVQYLSEEVGEMGEGVLDRARGLFIEYLQGLAGLRGGWIREAAIPEEPGLLSYTIGRYLEIPLRAQQRLLELPYSGERLYYEVPLLEGANKRLKEEIAKRGPQGPRLN